MTLPERKKKKTYYWTLTRLYDWLFVVMMLGLWKAIELMWHLIRWWWCYGDSKRETRTRS